MPLSKRVARFNRTIGNRLVGPVLSRLPGFGTIYHRGRRSGREYRTPVKIFRHADGYIITLPYGPRSDWVQNVLAAGKCRLRTRGRLIELTRPTLFEDDGRTPIPTLARLAMRRIKATTFLALTPMPPVRHAADPGAADRDPGGRAVT